MIRIELDTFTVKVLDATINKMLKFKQDTNNKHESGGIILGYYIDETSFTLTDITIPTNLDKSSRYGFVRSWETAQKAINEFFRESCGKKIYLGEWHTHPEDLPVPSLLDCVSIEGQTKLNRLNSNVVFMIIIGNVGLSISVVKDKKIIIHKNILYTQLQV